MGEAHSRDGTVIAFDKSGEGPPLVLVGGALSDRSAAQPLAALLAPGFTVYAYDRRGRGDSGDTPPFAVEREVEDLDALIGLAGGSAFVYGHSSGAALALEAARAHLRILRLALYEPPYIVDDSRPPLPNDHLSHLQTLLAAGRRDEAVAYFMAEGVGVPPEVIETMRAGPTWAEMEALAHVLPYDMAIMDGRVSGNPLPGEWAAITIPTLVLDGELSDTWQRRSVGALADLLPGAQRRTLEGQTHRADPAILAPVLHAFFD